MSKNEDGVSETIIGKNLLREGGIGKIINDTPKNEPAKLPQSQGKKEDLIGVEKEDEFLKKDWTRFNRDSPTSHRSVNANPRKKKGSFTCTWDDTFFSNKMGESSNQREEQYYILEMKEGDMKEFVFLVRKGGFLTFILKRDFFFKCFIQRILELEHKIKVVHQFEHEFRTSLNCIVSMLQTISQAVDEDIMLLCVSPALTSSMFLLNLINDMVDFLQLEVI